MNKSLALLTVLLIALSFLIVSAASVATTPDEIIIPMNKYVNFSNNLSVYLVQVTISNYSYYSTYSPDTANTVWPILIFRYENHGKAQVPCRFHVQIVDNTSQVPAGWDYDNLDESIYQPLYPNQDSSTMTMEFAMPSNRILTNLSVIDDILKKEIANIPIIYPTPTPLPTATPVPGPFDDGGESMRNLMLIPILLGLVGLIGWFMARKRLF